MTKGKFRSYWSETGSYEVVIPLICMNFDGLKTAIIEMLSGAEVEVNTASFKNDPAKIQNRDDVITYLIHLGYLGYNEENGTAFVPNEEIRQELSTAVRNSNWNEMIAFQQESRKLLMATLTKNEKCVAQEIEKIHNDYVSIIQYNNENSLSSVLAIAYLGSMQYYFKPVREMPTGYGFADLIFVPKPEYVNSYPSMVMELKWNNMGVKHGGQAPLTGLLLFGGAATCMKDALLYQNYFAAEEFSKKKGLLGMLLRSQTSQEKTNAKVDAMFQKCISATKDRVFFCGAILNAKWVKEHARYCSEDYVTLLKRYGKPILAVTGTADISTDYRRLSVLNDIPLADSYTPHNVNHILREIDDNNSVMTVKKQYCRLAAQPLHREIEQKIQKWLSSFKVEEDKK